MNRLENFQSLLRKIDEWGYRHFCRIVREGEYYTNPWPNFRLVKNRILLTTEGPTQQLLLLFMLGIPVLTAEVGDIFSVEELQALLGAGILQMDGDYVQSTKALVPFVDVYLFVDFPYFYPTCIDQQTPVYLGEDSFLLASLLPVGQYGKVLDLCTGSGIQAILLGCRNPEVLGVDISPQAVEIARLNALVNDRATTVKFMQSDLFSRVEGQFNLITANPPTQVIPESVCYPVIGDGGADGLKVFGNIMHQLDEYLAPDGTFLTIVQLLGDEAGPAYLASLQAITEKNCWQTEVTIHHRIPLSIQARVMSECASRILGQQYSPEQWLSTYERENLNYLYNVVVLIRKTGYPKFHITRLNFWNDGDTPVKLIAEEVESVSRFRLKPTGKMLNLVEKRFLQLCDGSSTLKAIKERLRNELELNPDSEYQLENLCIWLQNNGLIHRKGE